MWDEFFVCPILFNEQEGFFNETSCLERIRASIPGKHQRLKIVEKNTRLVEYIFGAGSRCSILGIAINRRIESSLLLGQRTRLENLTNINEQDRILDNRIRCDNDNRLSVRAA